jgi:hypothetical protein
MTDTLPVGCEIEATNDRLYLKFDGLYVVTKQTGQRKYIRGTDPVSVQRATRWAWQFAYGSHTEYETSSQFI